MVWNFVILYRWVQTMPIVSQCCFGFGLRLWVKNFGGLGLGVGLRISGFGFGLEGFGIRVQG